MRQIFLQKILDKEANLDDDTTSSAALSTKPQPKNEDYQDSLDPYDL